ncbi:hypothetical protein DFP72DRAFT_856342 [Ephemerocybe angulata]|uniref:Uncharacterized protein n=1 Tax=Ephemerocybe angulata TaxID=980116 RepID=A0A8H6HGX2_9AGAR|nr:hypothetical protein DFP72DRAFT_856342 [Tulosesus angulatus]
MSSLRVSIIYSLSILSLFVPMPIFPLSTCMSSSFPLLNLKATPRLNNTLPIEVGDGSNNKLLVVPIFETIEEVDCLRDSRTKSIRISETSVQLVSGLLSFAMGTVWEPLGRTEGSPGRRWAEGDVVGADVECPASGETWWRRNEMPGVVGREEGADAKCLACWAHRRRGGRRNEVLGVVGREGDAAEGKNEVLGRWTLVGRAEENVLGVDAERRASLDAKETWWRRNKAPGAEGARHLDILGAIAQGYEAPYSQISQSILMAAIFVASHHDSTSTGLHETYKNSNRRRCVERFAYCSKFVEGLCSMCTASSPGWGRHKLPGIIGREGRGGGRNEVLGVVGCGGDVMVSDAKSGICGREEAVPGVVGRKRDALRKERSPRRCEREGGAVEKRAKSLAPLDTRKACQGQK